MAAMAEVCAIHFVARRNAQNARTALCTAGSAHCSDVAAQHNMVSSGAG